MRHMRVTGPKFTDIYSDYEPPSDRIRDEQAASHFPVYPDLVTRLTTAEKQPDTENVIPHVMAACAAYSYAGWGQKGDPETLATMMTRLGMEENRCLVFEQRVNALYIASAAYVIQDRDRKVAILCYRGTPPEDIISVLADADVSPDRISLDMGNETHGVHAGFYRNVRATRHPIIEALNRAVAGDSILSDDEPGTPAELEALYITGHSMGGAMAALMAIMLLSDERYSGIAKKIKGVYTFGQPMMGDLRFAQACENKEFPGNGHILRDKLIRYIYHRDVVPCLPPRPVGQYAPFGREYHFGKSIGVVDAAFQLGGEVLDAALSFPGDVLAATQEFSVPQSALSRLKAQTRALSWAGRGIAEAAEAVGRAAWPPFRTTDAWRERSGTARSRQMRNLAGLALVAPLAYVASRLALTRGVPFKYSFGDHECSHYLSTLAPDLVLDEFGEMKHMKHAVEDGAGWDAHPGDPGTGEVPDWPRAMD